MSNPTSNKWHRLWRFGVDSRLDGPTAVGWRENIDRWFPGISDAELFEAVDDIIEQKNIGKLKMVNRDLALLKKTIEKIRDRRNAYTEPQQTEEGFLPSSSGGCPHCVEGSPGWSICPSKFNTTESIPCQHCDAGKKVEARVYPIVSPQLREKFQKRDAARLEAEEATKREIGKAEQMVQSGEARDKMHAYELMYSKSAGKDPVTETETLGGAMAQSAKHGFAEPAARPLPKREQEDREPIAMADENGYF